MTDRTESINDIENLRNILRDEDLSLDELKGLAESIKEQVYHIDQVLYESAGEK